MPSRKAYGTRMNKLTLVTFRKAFSRNGAAPPRRGPRTSVTRANVKRTHETFNVAIAVKYSKAGGQRLVKYANALRAFFLSFQALSPSPAEKSGSPASTPARFQCWRGEEMTVEWLLGLRGDGKRSFLRTKLSTSQAQQQPNNKNKDSYRHTFQHFQLA